MTADPPADPRKTPDYPWLFETRARPAAKRIILYAAAAMIVPAYVIFILHDLELDTPNEIGRKWELPCVLALIVILIAGIRVWRWRLCVEPRGVWARTLVGWWFGAWEKPEFDDTTGVETGKTTPFRFLALTWMMRDEDRRRVMEFHSDFAPIPPLPEPAGEITVEGWRQRLDFDIDGLTHHQKKKDDQRLAWDEIESIELIVNDHRARHLRAVRVTSPSGTIDLPYSEDFIQGPSLIAAFMRDPDSVALGPGLIATLPNHLPEGALVVTARDGRPRDIGEARRRAIQELRQLKSTRKDYRISFWMFCPLALLIVGAFLWEAQAAMERWSLPGTVAIISSVFFIGPPLLLLIHLGFHRFNPRRGTLYREYQQYKAQNH